ncbi:hypothetical protein [Pseudothermotoga sp.]|nr:hypothetical protein [Pseudothermotoga sp.]MDW8140365.1 hypothetical protein [Pseudothermotoga sp.]
MKHLKRRRDNFIGKVMIVTFFVIMFLWAGFCLHLVVETKKNAELVERRDSLLKQVEELAKEVNVLKENKPR